MVDVFQLETGDEESGVGLLATGGRGILAGELRLGVKEGGRGRRERADTCRLVAHSMTSKPF